MIPARISRLRRAALAMGCAISALIIPASAHADPITAAVVAVVNIIGGATVAAAVGNFLIAYGGTLYATAASWALTKLSTPKGTAAAQERQASVVTLSVGEVARELALGRVCTAGSLVNAFNYGGQYGTDWECQIRALADHEIDALEGFFVADTYYPYTGNGLQAAFNNNLDLEFVNGVAGVAAPPARFATAAGLDSTDRLKSVSHVYFAYKASPETWPQGRPAVKFVLRGKRCYDPRKDSTVPGGSGSHLWDDPSTWEWSENAQVCRYNWVRGVYALDQVDQPSQLLIGRGLTAVEAPPERIFAAANVCDEAVALLAGGTEPRYRVGGIIRADESFDVVEQMFAAAMAGVIVQREGGVEIEPGQGKSAAREITDLDLVAGEKVTFDRFMSDTQRINSVLPRYVEPDQNWSDHAAPIRRSITDINSDGGPREEPLSLSLVTSGTQAQRCGEIQRRQARRERRATIVLGPRFSALEEGDWIGWTSDRRHGGERVVYRVEAYSRAPSWRRTLALREISASDYSWTAATDEYVPGTAPPPEPGAPGPLILSSVAITAVDLPSDDGVSSVPGVQATWDVPVDAAVLAIRLEIRLLGEVEVATTNAPDVNAGVMVATNGVAPGAQLQGRLVPLGDGGREKTASAWVTITAGGIVLADVVAAISDGVLTPSDKLFVVPWIKGLISARTGLRERADALNLLVGNNLNRLAYETAATDLDAQLATLTAPVAWDDSSGLTTVPDAIALRGALEDTQTSAAALQWEIDTAYGTYISDLTDTIDVLVDAAGDGVLSTGEKLTVIPGINSLRFARAALRDRANAMNLTVALGNAERIAFEDAADFLDDVLATLTTPVAWNNTTDSTTIPSPGDFRTALEDAYLTTYDLQTKIDGEPTGGVFGVNILEAAGGSVAALSAFKTALGIAASIAGQASAATDASIQSGATKNLLYFQSSSPSSPADGALWCDTTATPFVWKIRISGSWQSAASYGGLFGSSLYESAGVLATNSNYKTALGTAAAIIAQTGWATYATLTPTTIAGRTQYQSTDGRIYDYRGVLFGYSVDGVAGRYTQPLSAGVGSISVASHSVYFPGLSGVTTISIPSTSFSGLSHDTNYTIFYRPEYGDWFPIVSSSAAPYKTSRDGYLEVGTISTPTSGGTWVAPTSDFESTGRYSFYDCIWVEALLASGKRAGSAQRRDALTMMAPGGDIAMRGEVNAIRFARAECVTLRTENGGKITVSLTAPIMTRLGQGYMPHQVEAGDCVPGMAIPTLGEDDQVVWTLLESVTPAGVLDVAMISALNGIYAAGDPDSAVMIFTHNMYNKQ